MWPALEPGRWKTDNQGVRKARPIASTAKLLCVGLPTGNVHPFSDFSNWLLVKLR